MSYTFKGYIGTLGTIFGLISSLLLVLGFLTDLKTASNLNEFLKIGFLYYGIAPFYAVLLEILRNHLSTVLVKWIGIPLYVFAFMWQLVTFAL